MIHLYAATWVIKWKIFHSLFKMIWYAPSLRNYKQCIFKNNFRKALSPKCTSWHSLSQFLIKRMTCKIFFLKITFFKAVKEQFDFYSYFNDCIHFFLTEVSNYRLILSIAVILNWLSLALFPMALLFLEKG